MEAVTAAVEADVNPHRVIIDCTCSDDVASYYDRWLHAGINVISPNKMLGSGPCARYDAVRASSTAKPFYPALAQWHYESSVGAALPMVTTLRDLMLTGDTVQRVEGCLSQTMAYVLRRFSETVPFSQAVGEAVELGLTETDLREDLSSVDTARKVGRSLARSVARSVGRSGSFSRSVGRSVGLDRSVDRSLGQESSRCV